MIGAYPFFENRKVIDLNGSWGFQYLGEDVDLSEFALENIRYTEKAAVPGVFDAMPKYVGERGTALYNKKITVTANVPGKIFFGGAGLWFRVYIDGIAIGECSLPYSGVSFDVPASANRERDITILVDNRFDSERVPLFNEFFDFYAYGGFYRGIEFHELPASYINRVQISTVQLKPAVVNVKVIQGCDCQPDDCFDVSLNGSLVERVDGVDLVEGVAEFRVELGDIDCWSPESPALHELTISSDHDSITERFGLRTVSAKGNKVYVNDKAYKLLGYCRHEAHPQCGPALPMQILINDIQQLKDLGCNFVRGSHYPQDQRFLDLCDEYGLLFFEESLGWGQQEEHFTNEEYVAQCETQTRIMVQNSYNHPSVIMWGFLNEGASEIECSRLVYETMVNALREEDSTRLVTYASNRNERDINLDLVDVVSYNFYPAWYGDRDNHPKLIDVNNTMRRLAKFRTDTQPGKPFIVSEIGAGAIYGWRDPHEGHWSEEYQCKLLATACNEVVENDDIAGISLWQFGDCRTYQNFGNLGRPRAFNNKGTVDEYRRPKMAYKTVKEIFSKKTEE
ncbi:MAG: beta-galactosidase [Kiritimatiellae bacterium]|jgi:beta-glucuronidase|nr:beta-galactosidase [Kiritimatiellia bacterium]